ncbi:lipoyl(octanoyl) transferase LipB [Aliikangiella marina]|uniref:Octanoyltransferase n=1 Tax=Aliikangiella marina TaxID=1712262 RepID=A0A545T9U3_9GAMM|nr:lipoyl(octanoyl) transferase LipB [Aliikangiella marina]TQV73979.1 lipoyl(octanoyl) transferase LipB [Aliikangiella marina]
MSNNVANSAKEPLLDNLIEIKHLGRQAYEPIWRQMQQYTDTRDENTPDQIWLVEHDPVFTQGQAGKAEHILAPGDIPVVQVDRGGQVTYHGPGQLVVYFMLDLRRKKLGVRELVTAIENAVVSLLSEYQISSSPRADAPGVYVGEDKICSLGLRIRRGSSFHGLALNVDMDTSPFSRINPCGYAGMKVTQIVDHAGPSSLAKVADDLIGAIMRSLNYEQSIIVE